MMHRIDRDADLPDRPVALARAEARAGSVVVTFKRRKPLVAAGQAPLRASLGEEPAPASTDSRRPRVFVVDAGNANVGDGSGRSDADERAADPAAPGPSAVPVPQRRRRRDPSRAPGTVTRIVLRPDTERQEAPTVEAPPSYEQVLQALDETRRTLRLAREARAFTILR